MQEPSMELVRALSGRPDDFDGWDLTVNARLWMKRFERNLMERGMHNKGRLAADYFGTFMTGASHDWFSAQPLSTKASFQTLKAAFFKRFDVPAVTRSSTANLLKAFEDHLHPALTVEDTQPLYTWWDWLHRLKPLADLIPSHQIDPSVLADKAWNALPEALRAELDKPFDSVWDLNNACIKLPKDRYHKLRRNSNSSDASQDRIRQLEETVARLERLAASAGAPGFANKRNRFTNFD